QHENKLRLLKAKFLLQQQLKAERAAKNRRLLVILCEGLKSCAEAEDADGEFVAEFREYFGVKLKACLVKMHAATAMAKNAKDSDSINTFADNLKYLRTTLPNYIDKSFLLWLVEVTCHTAISSFQPGSTAEMRQLVDFGQDFFDKVSQEQPVSPDFRLHHLIITGFYYLSRTGKMNKVAPLLETIQALSKATESGGDQTRAGVMKESYLKAIVDSMRVSVVASSEPKQALDLAMNTILAAQANLQTFAQHPGVRLMFTATLFDMLHVYCQLLAQQCRYADMGASIVQMTTLFGAYKADLERTIFYRFFLARCHLLIAKYDLALAKWLWATEGLSRGAIEEAADPPRFTQHTALENLRPRAFTLLDEAIQRINASMNGGETMSEIMALFGSQLVSFGKVEQGEEMLTNAVRTTLHSKNVLLQTRLLADVFELYKNKGLVEAQATAAAKYNKKVAVLHQRVAAAQAEEATVSALLRWTAGRATASTPSRG
ncbi:hypothetical protein PHYSODRAFT_474244, partial [Phytophthora sojae]